MAYASDKILQNTVYHGDQKKNTFERYIAMQKEKHTITGIKYGALNSIKTTILETAPYLKDFDTSGTLYKDYIKQSQDMNIELNTSVVVTKSGDSSGKGNLTGDIDIEDSYYKIEV